MKVRQIIDIMIKNNEFGEKIRFHYDRLSTLNYLKMDGKLMDFVKKQVDRGEKLQPALLDYDNKILAKHKPLLDEVIKEYTEWLETEI